MAVVAPRRAGATTAFRLNPYNYHNPCKDCYMFAIAEKVCQPPEGADEALRYLRDRISVPRDMSIYAAKHLREALEKTAAKAGDRQGRPLSTRDRRDQNPANFGKV